MLLFRVCKVPSFSLGYYHAREHTSFCCVVVFLLCVGIYLGVHRCTPKTYHVLCIHLQWSLKC